VNVAYFSPMPPETSGIADYSALLLPALRRRVEVTVAKHGAKRPPRGTGVALYHVGNDPKAHGWILDALRRRPGVVVLHEFVLHHLVSGATLAKGDVKGYLDALERDGGLVARLLGHAVVEQRIPPLWESRAQDFPLAGAVLDHAVGLIVHSRYVAEHARTAGYDRPIAVVPHPAWPDPGTTPAEIPGSPLIGCFGHVNASKRVPQLLAAFARVRGRHPEARLLLVGSTSPNFDLEKRLQRLGLDTGGVVRESRVDEARLWSLLAACDVCVNLRAPTMGETSGTAIRALTLGKPLLVSGIGWFAELPDGVALKAQPDEHEAEALEAALELLVTRPDLRAELGAAARELARTEHDVDRVADRYVAALELALGGEAVDGAVLREVGSAPAAVGIAPGSPEATELARRLSEVELGG